MVVAILQFDLLIHGAESLKDKRRVVNSLKDRLHHDHMVSVAEIGALSSPSVARMGLSLVTNDTKHAAQVLDGITLKLRALHDAELGDISREILSPRGEETYADDPKAGTDAVLAEELMRYAESDMPRPSRSDGTINP